MMRGVATLLAIALTSLGGARLILRRAVRAHARAARSAQTLAGVAELADAQDLGSCTERCRGSTPLSCIVAEDRRLKIEDRRSRDGVLAILYLLSSILVLPAAARGDTLWV